VPPEGVIEVVNRYNAGAAAPQLSAVSPIVLPRDRHLRSPDRSQFLASVVDHRTRPGSRALGRLARHLLGRDVGVALGGGAAFGLAHVGVMKALDDHGIPVDAIVGTSMGSIVAAAYAAGLDTDEMVRIALELGNDIRRIVSVLDLNPFSPGIVSGDRMEHIFGPLLDEVDTFADLVVPLRTVATDIETGERISLDRGRVFDAVRASSAIPIVIAPMQLDGRVLVDGAMCDPVPAGVVADMGSSIVIAVNVVPQLRKGVTTVLSRASQRVAALNPMNLVRRRGPRPNLVDLAMNSIQTLQHELGDFKAIGADALITPDLADFTWIDFYRPGELIDRGEAATKAAIPEIERVLGSRGRFPALVADA